MPHDVFISYGSEDKAVALEICGNLESRGFVCWYAPRDIVTGASWAESIADAIPCSRLVVLVLSPRALQSPHVRTEVRQAFDLNKCGNRLPILPFMIEMVPPDTELKYMLGGFQTLDATGGTLEEHIEHLGRDVSTLLGAPTRSGGENEASRAQVDTLVRGKTTDANARLRIVLSFRHSAQPDERLTHLIEAEMARRGHDVFVDRQTKFSLESGKVIDEQLRQADVLVPLLSAKSASSEMLEWEVRTAFDAAQSRGGKPRLLPVRVAFDGPLAADLAVILDPIPPFQWLGPQDDSRLVAELADAVHGPRPIALPRPVPFGGLPLDAKSYVRRPSDLTFHAAIARGDSIVLVRSARQMGKTSLLARGLDRAAEDGKRVAFSDFQRLNRADLESPEAFYQSLGAALADELELDATPAKLWDRDRAPNVNFEAFVRAHVLETSDVPLVWALDEVDRLFTCGFGNEVFALFRSWHNARTLRRGATWKRLTMTIGYATEAHLFITDLNQSPFNVGTTVALEEFTLDQVSDLNARYGHPLKDEKGLKSFVSLVGGHPFLVHRGLFEMAETGMSLADFTAQAEREEGLFGDHLRRMLVLLAQDAELCAIARGVLHNQPCPTPASFYRLRAAGVIAGETAASAQPRNKLYANYLKKNLG